MKNVIVMNLRVFPVKAHDHRDGEEKEIAVPVTREQLQAVNLVNVGLTAKENRAAFLGELCENQGYTVLEIGEPVKVPALLDLETLVKRFVREQGGKRASEADANRKSSGVYGDLSLENQAKVDALALNLLSEQEKAGEARDHA